MEILKRRILRQFHSFLEEDRAGEDLSSLLWDKQKIQAEVLLKSPAYVPQLFIFDWILSDFNINILNKIEEDREYNFPTRIYLLEGSAAELLGIERTFLNLLSHFLSISTITYKALKLKKLVKSNTLIAGTRKTLPGLRLFEKFAILLSGGETHRWNLQDMVMVKDNHIKAWKQRGKDIRELIKSLRALVGFSKKIEVEVDNEELLEEVLESSQVDIVMLDNFKPEQLKRLIGFIKKRNPHLLIEVSGGITLNNLKDYLEVGADVVSMGILTKQGVLIDVSMEVLE